MAAYDTTGAKVLRRADTKGIPEDFALPKPRYGLGVSWQARAGKEVDIDLQCVVVDQSGVIVDCAYYNNLKAAGVTHSGDEQGGKPNGIQELVWVTIPKLGSNVAVLIFVIAAYSGGYLRDVANGQLHILEESQKREIAQFEMERSAASVDVVAAMFRGSDGAWRLRIIDEPAQQGQHFMDILPLLAQTVRLFLPNAPKRQKVAFAMEKGAVLDLPKDLSSMTVGLGWDTDEGEVDLDVSAILLDASGRDIEAVFFGRLESDEHGIVHTGDNLTGEGEGDDEQIIVGLDRVGPQVQQIFFVINIYSAQKTFLEVANPYCRVVDDSSGAELCRYSLRDAGRENGLMIAKIAREAGGRWGFHALGLPSRGRTFKDSLPDIRRACQVKTQSLLLRQGSGVSAVGYAPSAPPMGAPPLVHPPPHVANPGSKDCCHVQ